MKDLAGRTAFVTGGANGIGLGLARVLLDQGCKVVIADIREDSIEQALAVLDNREVTGIRLDVASRDGFAAAADEAEARMGPVTLLFNNAGVNLFRSIDESSYEDWDWVLGVNLQGVINGVQTFVPRMKERGLGGHIINTASMASFLASGMPGIYNCAKFAVRGLSEQLRHEPPRPRHRRLGALCPGLVNSEIYRSDDPPGRACQGRPCDRPGIRPDPRQGPPDWHGSGRGRREGRRRDKGQPLLHLQPSRVQRRAQGSVRPDPRTVQR
jgi:NAD(P)-dependent dehydrogenase (short-subunit alcohol dehydrogenase family)